MPGEQGFLDLLDDLGLPHRATISDLRKRYGVGRSPYYGWSIVEAIDAKSILPGQVAAFHFTCNDDPDLLPPVSFSTFVLIDADAHTNHQRTLQSLSDLFRAAPVARSAANTIGHLWRFGPGAVEILTWPPELNRQHVNPAVAQHPELAGFCHLRLTAGHRPPLTPDEAIWLRDPSPFAALPGDVRVSVVPFDELWNGTHLAVQRRVPISFPRSVAVFGASRDAQALVGIDHDQAFVLPRSVLSACRLSRVAPTRGQGGSSLAIDYADRFASRRPLRKFTICTSPRIVGLDRLATEIAEWARVDLAVSEYCDD